MTTVLTTTMTPKQKLYNVLIERGVMLPEFSASCVTVKSLNRHLQQTCYVPYVIEFQTILQRDLVLLGNPDFAFDILQRLIYQQTGQLLPFIRSPPIPYLVCLLAKFDPENRLELLKRTWKDSSKKYLMEKTGQVFEWRPEPNTQQKILDNYINLATKNYLHETFSRISLAESKGAVEKLREEIKKDPQYENLPTLDRTLVDSASEDPFQDILKRILPQGVIEAYNGERIPFLPSAEKLESKPPEEKRKLMAEASDGEDVEEVEMPASNFRSASPPQGQPPELSRLLQVPQTQALPPPANPEKIMLEEKLPKKAKINKKKAKTLSSSKKWTAPEPEMSEEDERDSEE